MENGKDLGINVNDGVKTAEGFGPQAQAQLERQMKGVGGTLHLTRIEDAKKIGELAVELSRQTKLPVVIVVKGY